MWMMRELQHLLDTVKAPIVANDVHRNVNKWKEKTTNIIGFTKEVLVLNQPFYFSNQSPC
jgi:hypothetical protein